MQLYRYDDASCVLTEEEEVVDIYFNKRSKTVASNVTVFTMLPTMLQLPTIHFYL